MEVAVCAAPSAGQHGPAPRRLSRAILSNIRRAAGDAPAREPPKCTVVREAQPFGLDHRVRQRENAGGRVFQARHALISSKVKEKTADCRRLLVVERVGQDCGPAPPSDAGVGRRVF